LQNSRIGRTGQRELHVHGVHVVWVLSAASMIATDSIVELSAANRTRTRFAARIGGTTLGVTSGHVNLSIVPDSELNAFLIPDQRCDVECTARFVNAVSEFEGELVFDSGGLWKLYRNAAGYCFRFATSFLGDTPYKQAIVSPDFTKVRIDLVQRFYDPSKPWNPLEYPLDELLWIHRLSMKQGVEMHGCGVITPDGRGFLLTGHSGAGKSTSARMWARNAAARVLSDDRIILRAEGDRIWMYGTPWHGDAGIAEADRFPLDGIFVLEHGAENRMQPLNPTKASAELFARSFVPHHSVEGLNFVLEFFDQLTSLVPCFSFPFVPNATAVEALLASSTGKIAAA
jgi:hypothetical protein